MSERHYSAHNVKRSLAHFVMGKGLAALLGVAWLLLLVRALPTQDYAVYVALTGFFEISYLVTSVGSINVVERFAPAYRAGADDGRLRRLLIEALSVRVLTLLVFCAFSLAFLPRLISGFGVVISPVVFAVWHAVIVGEGTCRFIEAIFALLLKQGYAQLSMLLRYGVRLAALVIAFATAGEVSIERWVILEAGCALFGLLVAALLIFHILTGLRPDSAARLSARVRDWRGYARFAVPVHVAQVFVLSASLETAKLISAGRYAANEVATFGFCVAIVAVLQRYLPAYMLFGLVQPLFMTASSLDRLRFMCRLFVKLTVFTVLPVLVVFAALGDRGLSLLSGQQMTHAGLLISILSFYLLIQSVKMVHSLNLMRHDDGTGILQCVVAGAVVFWLSVLVSSDMGTAFLAMTLVASEGATLVAMRARMRRRGWGVDLPSMSMFKMLAAAGLAFGLSHVAQLALPSALTITLIGTCALAVALYLALGVVFKPFDEDERESINRVLPRKMFFW